MQVEASPPHMEGKKPGAHLLRHQLTGEVAAAAAQCLGADREQAGVAVVQLRQPELRQTFSRVFGVHTSSGNNDWMRGKLLQALGLSPHWRPVAVQQHDSPTASDEGSHAIGSLRHSHRARRPPASLQLDSATSMEEAEALGQKRRKAGSGADNTAKRARQSPEAPHSLCGTPADRPAPCSGSVSPTTSQHLQAVVPVRNAHSHVPLHPVAPTAAAAAAAAAALSMPFARADSSLGIWPPSPGTLSCQQSRQQVPLTQRAASGLPPAMAAHDVMASQHAGGTPQQQQAAMAALQALGFPPSTAQMITSHPRVADAMLRQRFGQVPPPAWQAAPPCYPIDAGCSDRLPQQLSSAASSAAAQAAAAEATHAYQAAAAQWGTGRQAEAENMLLPLQSHPHRSFTFWGAASPQPLATPAQQQQQAAAPVAWSPFAFASACAPYGTNPGSAALPPAVQVQPAQQMRLVVAGPDPAAMPTPFAGYWPSAPPTLPGSPPVGAALHPLHSAPSGPAPSFFAAYACVPLQRPAKAPLPAQHAQRFTAGPALLALAGLGEGDLFGGPDCDDIDDGDLNTLFLAWQEQDTASLAPLE